MRSQDVGARALAHLKRGIAALFAALALAGCSGGPKINVVPGDIVVRSRDFETGGMIPARFTCDGDDVSPSLFWSNLPPGTHSVDLLMIDPDASDFVHWRVDGIAATVNALAIGDVPPGIARKNGFGTVGYKGPCPPRRHRYVIEVRAFSGLRGTGRQLGAGNLEAAYERGATSPSP